MTLALLSVGGGAYCSWRFVGGWSGLSLHPILGLATITAMLLQVLLAMCRCAPHHSARFIFNWLHFALGNGTHVCAIGTLFSAYEATPLPVLFLYLMAAFILFHVLIHLIMQIKRDPAVDGESRLLHDPLSLSCCSLTLIPGIVGQANKFDMASASHPTNCHICSVARFGSQFFFLSCFSDPQDMAISDSMQRFHIEVVGRKVS